MLHHKIHICAGRWNGSSAAKIQWAVDTVSKGTCWKRRERGRKGRLSLARSGVPSLGFYHSVCFSLLDALKIDANLPSQWVPPPSLHLPLEVLIRAAVTRLIVASRGQLSHSWAAHFTAGSVLKQMSAICVTWKTETVLLLQIHVSDAGGVQYVVAVTNTEHCTGPVLSK